MNGLVLVLPASHEQNAGKRRHSRQGVNYDATGEIKHTPIGQHASAPDHVNKWEVDEQLPSHQEYEVGLEGDSIGEGAGDEGRRDDREHHLVDDEQQGRHGAGEVTRTDALQEGKFQVPDDSTGAAAEA